MLVSRKAGKLCTGTGSPFGSGLLIFHPASVHVYITPAQRLQSAKTRSASMFNTLHYRCHPSCALHSLQKSTDFNVFVLET
jgi:hypothetical protein